MKDDIFLDTENQEVIIPEDEFLSVGGAWEDDRSVEEQIEDIYSSKKSTNRTEEIF